MGDDRMKIAKKAVCLCSGGMDSTTAATIAKRAGYELYLFHVNYGQKAEKKELEVISKLKETLGAARSGLCGHRSVSQSFSPDQLRSRDTYGRQG